jgi:hypothetical protein
MAEVIFERTLITGIPNPRPNEEQNFGEFELVTGIHALKTDVNLGWRVMDQYIGEELGPLRQNMPGKMARRLLSFCDITILADNKEFDCHSFVCYMRDWQDDLSPAGPHVFANTGPYLPITAPTTPNEPYRAVSRGSDYLTYGHSFFGTSRQGYWFSVLGPGNPLVFGRKEMLRSWFGLNQFQALRRVGGQSPR